MKSCPSCHAENVDDAIFCDNCGATLNAAPVAPPPPIPQPSVAPVAPPPPPPPSPTPQAPAPSGVKCGTCGTANLPGSMYCENCGAALNVAPPQAPTMPAAPPPVVADQTPVAPTAPSSQPAPLKMIVATVASQPAPAGHPRFVLAPAGNYFDIFGRAQVVIGRVDPISQIFPDIDLTSFGGDEGGVSRKHCQITLAGNQYFAEDLGSSNGSWVGANRLQPNVRAALNNGDQLRLGKIVLNFFTGA